MFKSVGEGILIGLSVFILSQYFFNSRLVNSQPFPAADYLVTPTPTPSISSPSVLNIANLKIFSSVEPVGLDWTGRMDVPKNYKNVAWYQYGPKPGQIGNSVLAGHYDDPTGPSVFYRLNDLKTGDLIQVTTVTGQILNFEVIDKQIYKDKEFPLDLVFGPSTDSRLNLITCDGVYNQNSQSYSERLVIYTRLVSVR